MRLSSRSVHACSSQKEVFFHCSLLSTARLVEPERKTKKKKEKIPDFPDQRSTRQSSPSGKSNSRQAHTQSWIGI
jgi:hypothetical protein